MECRDLPLGIYHILKKRDISIKAARFSSTQIGLAMILYLENVSREQFSVSVLDRMMKELREKYNVSFIMYEGNKISEL